LPVILPDGGGASDQARRGGGFLYRARQADSLSATILSFVASEVATHRRHAHAAAASIMTMDEHFERLFSVYGQLAIGFRHAG
jgi:hypothetical protein